MKLLDYFAAFLRDTVNLSDSKLSLLDLRVDSIVAALGLDDEVGPLLKEHIRQGSWAHKTIINPLPGDEFDADILIHLDEVADWADSPKEYLRQVRAAFKRNADYADKVEKKNRCVRIKYAGACHVDVVPYVVREDGTGWIVSFADDAWEETNPQGYTDWINEKDRIAMGNLRRVLRLLKYLRDYKNTFSAKSVILTTVVGERIQDWEAAERYKDVPTALVGVLEDLHEWLDVRLTLPVIEDPSCPGTTFHHRWNQDQYANFRVQIERYATLAREAYDEPDKDKSLTAWQKIFGPDFKAPTETISESLATATIALDRTAREEYIESQVIATSNTGTAVIEAFFGLSGVPTRRLPRGMPIRKGMSLKFRVKSDAASPFQVFWKVRNFGEEAERAQDLRGQLMPGTIEHVESTKYRGKHFIECYVVKDRVLLASDRFNVLIM